MLSREKAENLPQEKKLELAKGMVRDEVEKILDRAIVIAISKNKNAVAHILGEGKLVGIYEESEGDKVENYLSLLGYENIDIQNKYSKGNNEHWMIVEFSIPK